MVFVEDLKKEVANIFSEKWSHRDGYLIPEVEDIALGNDAVDLEATVLYADMADSTGLVNRYKPFFAAEVFKAYLICCARLIRKNGGQITAYDGDRVMGVYDGVEQETNATKTALQINYAVRKVVNPALKAQYPSTTFELRHVVGIDTSNIRVARIGVRKDNDLVWVGRAANYAAKLCALRADDYCSWITGDVYDMLDDSLKKSTDGRSMWEERVWNAQNSLRIYRSNWRWAV